jgi:hypothetical protein
MNLQQLQALTDAQKSRYMTLGKLFEHPSWKFLIDWAQGNVSEATTRELNSTTWEHVLVNRGARLAFIDLVNLENAVEHEFEGYADEAIQNQAEAELQEQSGLEDV